MKLLTATSLWILLAAILVVLPAARGIWLELPSSGTRCVSEDLHNNVVVLGDYYSFFGESYDENATITHPSMTIKVTSPYGNELHHKEKVSHGQFAFTTTEAGNYLACFTADADPKGRTVTIGIDWKTGIAAKDWDSVARKEKIEGLELELKKLEGHVETIHENLINLMTREADMRIMSENTNSRVAWYSIMALGVCISVSLVQTWYLRSYFAKKKLI